MNLTTDFYLKYSIFAVEYICSILLGSLSFFPKLTIFMIS